jgi:hypothetical protein
MNPIPLLENQLFQSQEKMKSGARWFYWIAALSVINSIIAHAGGQWGFIVGLGVTRVADVMAGMLAENLGGAVKLVAVLFDIFAAAVFAGFGFFAVSRHAWSFVVGMMLHGLDGLLFPLIGDFLSILFHVFALYCIFAGFQACRRMGELERELAEQRFRGDAIAPAPNTPAP